MQEHPKIHDLFASIAASHPRRVAIDRVERQVTYAQLARAVGRLAHALLAQGVEPGSRVVILAQDPIEVVSSMLAILEVGGVFVPLDPTFPEARLAAMCQQAAPLWGALVGARQMDLWLGIAPPGSEHLALDGEDSSAYPETRPGIALPGDAPCSIYFTSGSTGRPKAILGQLRGIDHFVRWEAELLEVAAGTRVSQLASPSFDGFLKDVFVPLCVGGTACAPETRAVLLEPQRLIDWLDVEGIEIFHCVPSVLRSLLGESLDPRFFADLRWIVLAGEVLQASDVSRFRDVYGDRIRFLNLYGPTETTVTKLFHIVEPADLELPSIPIGKPMPGAAVMILDSAGRPCPAGVVGEITIRTPYAALGYANDPEQTRLAFITNPFSNDPNDRAYRTGDFGRQLKDGSLEFLGRRDQQVKIHGVRVEVGEIEGLLQRSSAVREAAVAAHADSDGGTLLCAYLVLAEDGEIAEARSELVAQLPETMVPAFFVELAELPRTLNGKVDRKALPSLEQLRADRRRRETSRRLNPLEEIVTGIWCDVLRRSGVGPDESFFELGGHSLLATQILSRLRESLAVELPLRVLFEAPTIAGLCDKIEQAQAEGPRHELPPIRPVRRDGELPLSYSQQRMWLLEQLSDGSASFNIPLGMRPRGLLDVATLEQTFSELIRRHEILRTTFPARDGLPAQRIGSPWAVRLPRVDLGDLPASSREGEVRRIVSSDARRPFDTARGPLVRVALLRLAEDDHVILCTVHHLLGDAWAFDVLAAEIGQLYAAFARSAPSPLPELPIQYADFAVWQREALSGPLLEERLDYWRHQLADAPTGSALPQRRSRGAVPTFRGARWPITLSAELTSALRALARRDGATLYMTLLSGFLVLLHHYSGQEDLVVGSVIANRDRAELEGLIGFVANTLVLRVDLSGGPSLRQLLPRVREVCLGAYSHQLPPELLGEGLGRDAGAGGRLFDVWFQMESPRRHQLELEGLTWGELEIDRGRPRFELSLVLEEGETTVEGEIEYDDELYSRDTISRLADDLHAVLLAMTARPDSDIGCLSLASDSEAEQLSVGFTSRLDG